MSAERFSRFGPVTANWPLIRLKEVIRERVKWIEISDTEKYKRVTARVRNQGIYARDSVSGSDIKTKRQKLCRADDLLVAEIDAKVGGFGIVPAEGDGAIVSSHYFLFELNQAKVDLQWFDHVVRAGKLQRQVDAVGSTNYAAIRPRDVAAFQMPLPEISEQRGIGAVLSSTGDLIANSKAVISALEAAKMATMRELLTRGVRRSAAPLQRLPARWVLGRIAEGVTHIPTYWSLVTLAKVAKLESGHTPSREHPEYWDGDIPWISLQDADALGMATIGNSAETIGPKGLAKSSARLLPAGTVVLQRTAKVGLASVMERPMATSQHFANWVCGPNLDPHYLQQVFRHMTREWQRLMAGSVLPDIYMGTFKALQILLPPIAEQKRIGAIGVAFDRRIEAEREALAVLIQNRDALAQELLSGRIRLPQAMIDRHRTTSAKAA